MSAAGGDGEDSALLKGKRFLLSQKACGPMKVHMLRSAISKHGGVVVTTRDDGVDFIMGEKSSESNPVTAARLREDLVACEGAVCVDVKWLERVVKEMSWREPDTETDLLILDRANVAEDAHVAKRRRTGADEEPATTDSPGEPDLLVKTAAGELAPAAPYLPNASRQPPRLGPGFQEVLRALVARANRGEELREALYADADCIAVYDAFPKARFHLLVLPRAPAELHELRSAHAPLLRHMHRVALHVIAEIRAARRAERAALPFRAGYHALPSIQHLHLHVISADFDSPCLKHKKHWNSFQPPFLIDSAELIARVERDGAANINRSEAEEQLKAALVSHRTGQVFKNIPQLKAHLASCSEEVTTGVVY